MVPDLTPPTVTPALVTERNAFADVAAADGGAPTVNFTVAVPPGPGGPTEAVMAEADTEPPAALIDLAIVDWKLDRNAAVAVGEDSAAAGNVAVDDTDIFSPLS